MVSKLILALQEEHGLILKGVEEFLKTVSGSTRPPDKVTSARLKGMGTEVFESLLAHTSREDDELLPFMRNNIVIFERQ